METSNILKSFQNQFFAYNLDLYREYCFHHGAEKSQCIKDWLISEYELNEFPKESAIILEHEFINNDDVEREFNFSKEIIESLRQAAKDKYLEIGLTEIDSECKATRLNTVSYYSERPSGKITGISMFPLIYPKEEDTNISKIEVTYIIGDLFTKLLFKVQPHSRMKIRMYVSTEWNLSSKMTE